MWNLVGTRAVWKDAPLTAEVNVADPAAGVALKAVGVGIPRNDYRFLKVLPVNRPPLTTPIEEYIRGSDLVATYEALPGDKVQPWIYWRAHEGTNHGGGIEAVVSTQTSLLDSEPAFAAECEMAIGDVLVLDGAGKSWSPISGRTSYTSGNEACGAFLIRPAAYRWSYLEAVFPSDFVATELTVGADRVKLRQRLFTERLEKGVIRRGRVLAWFLPREADEAEAIARWEIFRNSPPPLTA